MMDEWFKAFDRAQWRSLIHIADLATSLSAIRLLLLLLWWMSGHISNNIGIVMKVSERTLEWNLLLKK